MAGSAVLAIPGIFFGTLIDRGGGLIYDTDLNITWMKDANYGRTQYYQTGGNEGLGVTFSQIQAVKWAANLTYFDSVRNVTYSNWRLPRTLLPDYTCDGSAVGYPMFGYYCSGSEMGHLFYVELGIEIEPGYVPPYNASPFINLDRNWYWSETLADTSNPFDNAFVFGFNDGVQLYDPIDQPDYTLGAWAVRDGDVYAASEIPVPSALWLFGSSLLWFLGFMRRTTREYVLRIFDQLKGALISRPQVKDIWGPS